MPFEVFNPVLKPVSSVSDISATLSSYRGRDVILRFTIKGEAVGMIDGLADAESLPVDVLLGEGSDHGIIRIRAASTSDGVARIQRKGGHGKGHLSVHYYSLSLGHVARFVSESHPKADCSFERLEDGWLEIVLPSWSDKTAPKATARIDAVPPQIRAGEKEAARVEAERLEAIKRRNQREGGVDGAVEFAKSRGA